MTARAKHRRFLEVPELACLARTLPVWGTWDDHDFGKNDADGTLPGKAETRRAFVEYRAHVNDGDGGVFLRFCNLDHRMLRELDAVMGRLCFSTGDPADGDVVISELISCEAGPAAN